MLKNYFVTAWRNIVKAKGFSFLNIAGLAVGLAVCLLILLYVRAETSYDAYHAHVDRIYRIQNAWLNADGSIRGEFATLAPSYAILLSNDFPEIERLARTWNPSGTVVRAGDRTFTEERLFFAEPEIFDILTLPLVQGDPATALNDVGGIVLSRTTARRYFGDADPMGRSITLPSRGNLEFRVTGVMEDVPLHSHIHFDFLASYITLKGLSGSGDADYFHGTRNFSDNVTAVYVRLAAPNGGPELQAKMPAFLDRHFPAREDEQGRLVKTSESRTLHVQKVKDIHLYAHTRADFEPAGDIRTVRLFTIIALFILAIACVNFVNLSTARGAKRAKEVGLRKVVGAARRTLAAQFLGESFLVTFLALLLAMGLTLLALPAYGRFVGHPFGAATLVSPAGLGLLLAGFLLTGLAAGVYPAFFLASFRPSTILRGELTRGKGGVALRKGLVVCQFAISIALIFAVTVIARQTRFLRTADLGYARDNIICIPVETAVSRRWTDMKTALLREPTVLAATLSKRAPAGRLLDSPGFWAEIDGNRVQSAFGMPHNRVEHDFFKTYGMTLVAGRDFSVEIPSDAAEAFVLNETAVRRLGIQSPEDAVGMAFGTFAPNRNGRVIGVVRDFNYESMHSPIVPIVSYVAPEQANTLSLRIAPGSLDKVARHVQSVFDSIHPAGPVEYDFLSERLAALYRGEERAMRLFFLFSFLAVTIGCLGLFGLAAFSAERRTKEIGIRKVFGASAPSVAALLSREFTKWVVVANVVAWPVAAFGMHRWLRGFAYRVSIGIVPFVLSASLAMAVALLTVSYQAVRASLADPVRSLRYE
ncbi:MAG: ABC transporter permease [Candidatus Aminicenantes bacterium]|nr:ABC transporter permease [Candidatus Aminicenantes bacterium]